MRQVKIDLSDFVFAANTVEDLEKNICFFLSGKKIAAEVSREDGCVVVTYPEVKDIDADEDANLAMMLCRDGRFGKAKKLVNSWLERQPWSSEAYRVLAQIEMEGKNFDDAIKYATDSLKLSPRNEYALVLLGNLYGRDKDNPVEGLKYFKRSYELCPDSVLTLTNYAATLHMAKDPDIDFQESLYRKAIKIDPTYLNPYYALSQWYSDKEDWLGMFNLVQEGLKRGTDRPENPAPLRKILTQILIRSAKAVVDSSTIDTAVKIKDEVAKLSGLRVDVDKDDSLPCPAKVEMAERYQRDYHRLVYNGKGDKGIVEYSKIHELEKLLMRTQAIKNGKNCNFACNDAAKPAFREKSLSYVGDKLRKLVGANGLNDFIDDIFVKMGGQVMNAPLDLFTTQRIFEKYPEARAFQMSGVIELAQGALSSVQLGTENGIPKNIVRVNRLLNALTFIQYRDLLGLDLMPMLGAPDDELKSAKSLYAKFISLYESQNSGDEWTLVEEVIKELRLGEFYEVVGFGSTSESERGELADIAQDAADRMSMREQVGMESSNDQFLKDVDENPAIKSAIMMHMVGAIKKLRAMSAHEVKKIGFELATMGINGISPSKKSGYSIPSLPGKDMSGCVALAWYYASWRIGMPEAMEGLEKSLPFSDEYLSACAMVDAGM